MLHSILIKIKLLLNSLFNKKLNKSLSKLNLNNLDFSLTLIDIGAAGNIEPRWLNVSNNLNYIGFEPDNRSIELLTNDYNCKNYKIYPNALWNNNSKLKLHLTKKPECSSGYMPNYEFSNLFPFKERFLVDKTLEIDCLSLDALNINELDFIKMDIQGGELKVLEGGEESLKKCLGLEIEVEFLDIYKDQPLFGDVVKFLKDKEIEFMDFTSLHRWGRKQHDGFGQCVFGDALFLRSPEYILKNYQNNNEIKLKYLGICLIYNRFDLIDKLVDLSSIDFKNMLKPFLNSVNYFKRKNRNLRRIYSLFARFMVVLFPNSKSHVIY